MRAVTLYLLLGLQLSVAAQQNAVYTQLNFNMAGTDPGAAGADINQKFAYTFGMNRQWIGFNDPPRINFLNFSMNIRQPRAYHYWQTVTIAVETEEAGILTNNGVYGGYTFHLLLKRNWTAGLGVYGGLRMYYMSVGSIDPRDPIFQRSNYRAMMYPDIIPGLRLNNRKLYIDVAVRHLSTPRLKDFKGNSIGGPSTLKPSVFASIGRKFPLNDLFWIMPYLSLNSAVVGPPDVSLNTMVYYNSRMGAGAALRNFNFLSFIYQLRIIRTISVGFAYSASLNNVRYAAPGGFEVMIGVLPVGMDGRGSGRHSATRCPSLEF